MSINLRKQSKNMLLVYLFGMCVLICSDLVAGSKSSEVRANNDNSNVETVQLNDIIWSGSIRAGQAKNFSINLKFPYEGTFYVQATLASFDKNLYSWRNLTKSGLCITTSKANEANVRAAGLTECRGAPPVKGVKMTGAPGVSAPAFEKSATDTSNSVTEKPKVVIQPFVDKKHYRSGEGPFNVKMEFKSNPKIGEAVALFLSATSAVDFDSMSVMIAFTPDSVRVVNKK